VAAALSANGGEPLRLYFIRHGETAWALSGQHTGHANIPLTSHGEDEARGLAPYLQTISFTGILVSPLQRALHTCELAGLSATAEIDPDLAEWDCGDYEGVYSVDIRHSRPDWDILKDGCPNGESPAQILIRADRLIKRLRCLSGNIALFSHGQFGCVLAARWIGQPLIEARHFLLNTASISILTYRQDDIFTPAIGLWNCCGDMNSATM
jgi:probable phosphoglycerate mutase